MLPPLPLSLSVFEIPAALESNLPPRNHRASSTLTVSDRLDDDFDRIRFDVEYGREGEGLEKGCERKNRYLLLYGRMIKEEGGGGVVGVCGSHAHAGRVHTDFSTASRIIVSVPVIAKLEPDDTTSANHSRIGVLRPATLPARSHGRCSSLPWEQVNLVNVIKDGTTKCLVACAGNDGHLLWKV